MTSKRTTRVLGELEERLMEIVWKEHPLSVREVCARVRRTRLAYTTVMTTLDRLHTKGLLARTKQGNAFLYLPAIDHTEYQRRVIETALAPMFAQDAESVLAALIKVAASVDERNLARLERLIAEHRRRR
ncbi:MAG: BlaI/MecI/CopY family transcriptional regulator [Gemmatimonadaceae bacterium]|nr:BlaI/MecI/CopY family transcriptional regulator [Gemmatimonadaceae bacterium]